MIGLALDENFNNDILRGLLRRSPRLDLVRVQDAGLLGRDDETVLEWAAQQHRVLISEDVSTISAYAYARVTAGMSMPGVFEVPRTISISAAIEDLLLIAECSQSGEWEGQVRYLPLR
jgi:hypothetical protein